jgi:hypothetical protein
MVIRDTYINESAIIRMAFIADREFSDPFGKNIKVSYADIYTTTGSQIQVDCTEEEYKSALNYLEKNKVGLKLIEGEHNAD